MSALRTAMRNMAYGNAFTALLRIIIGALFIYSGCVKMLDLESFGRIIAMYEILPAVIVPYAAIFVPSLEAVLGILLFTGYRIRAASFLTAALLIIFSIAIGINVARGKVFECGCFELSRFGISEQISIFLIIRNIIIMLVLLLIFNVRKHVLSLEARIEKKTLSDL